MLQAAEKNGRAADMQGELEELFNHPKQKPEQGCYLHSCNLLARYGRAVKHARASYGSGSSLFSSARDA